MAKPKKIKRNSLSNNKVQPVSYVEKVDSQKAERKEERKRKSKAFANWSYSQVDNFDLSFFGNGGLSLVSVLESIVVIMITVFVIRNILFFGADQSFTFVEFLNFITSIDVGIDFSGIYQVIGSVSLPEWLAWLQPFVNILTDLVNCLVVVIEMLITAVSFVLQLLGFFVGK